MTVDQKIPVRSIFILANARLDYRRISHCRKTARDIFLHDFCFGSRRQARLRVGIDPLSMMIERNLQPAAFNVRHSVILIFLKQPRGQSRRRESRVSWRHAKKENFLAAGKNSMSENLGKNFAEPRAARENELRRRNRFAINAFHGVQMPSYLRRLNQSNPELHAQFDRILDNRRNSSTRQQYPALRL